MDYHKIIGYINKYKIKRYNDNGKPLTYNKLKNKITDHANEKQNLSQKQRLYNSINKYLNDDIDDQDLDNAMYHYIGK